MLVFKKLGFSLLLSFIAAIVLFFIVYQLAVLISPPVFYDSLTNEMHLVMPIGQVFLASILSSIAFIVFFILLYKRYPKIMARFGY